MSEYDNKGRFTLFKNEDKREGKKDPDYKGKYTDMDGVEYFADAWINTSKAGTKYMSGKMKRKDKQPDRAPPETVDTTLPTPPNDLDDEIPFF